MADTMETMDDREKNSSSGRNWSAQEKNLVWEQVCLAKQDGIPLTECFRQVSKLLPHRSEAAVGMLYYNVLRKEHTEDEGPVATEKKEPQAQTKKLTPKAKRDFRLDTDLVEAFQGLPEYMAQLHKRLDNLENQIKAPSTKSIVNSLVELANGYQENTSTQGEAKQLEEVILELKEENRLLTEKITKLEQSYDDALGIYDMFTNMASISQIMSLGDFKQQMKTTLDKWGNVLNVSFERAE